MGWRSGRAPRRRMGRCGLQAPHYRPLHGCQIRQALLDLHQSWLRVQQKGGMAMVAHLVKNFDPYSSDVACECMQAPAGRAARASTAMEGTAGVAPAAAGAAAACPSCRRGPAPLGPQRALLVSAPARRCPLAHLPSAPARCSSWRQVISTGTLAALCFPFPLFACSLEQN